MGKNKNSQDTCKTKPKKQTNVQVNIKRMKPQDDKPKAFKTNKTAELIHQKKQSEKAEKERKIMEYKKKRLEKTKVISKKTSRGQPLMKNRIEYLLKEIQEMKKH